VITQIGAALHVFLDEELDALAPEQLRFVNGSRMSVSITEAAASASQSCVGMSRPVFARPSTDAGSLFCINRSAPLCAGSVNLHALRQAVLRTPRSDDREKAGAPPATAPCSCDRPSEDVIGQVSSVDRSQITVQRAILVSGGQIAIEISSLVEAVLRCTIELALRRH